VASGDASTLSTTDAAAEKQIFTPVETRMVQDVLALANRPVQTIMTPRPEVTWIDAEDSKEAILASVRESPHRQFIVSRGSVDNVAGIARKEDIFELCMADTPFDLTTALLTPTAVHERASILDAFNLFKGKPIEMALVVDEYGGLQGIVTQTDLLEAIAGDLPEAEKEEPEVKELENSLFRVDGAMSIYEAQKRLGFGPLPQGDFNTVAGFALFLFGRIPALGERTDWSGWSFEVARMDGWRIDKLLVRHLIADEASDAPSDT